MSARKNCALYARVSNETKLAFVRKAEPYGTASDVLRELVLAYIDGRVVVTPRPLT